MTEDKPLEPESPVTPAPEGGEDVTAVAEPAVEVPRHKPAINAQGFCMGTGRRKSSVARVRLREGGGLIMVNGKEYKTFFCNDQDRHQVEAPMRVTETLGKIDVHIRVNGGGPTGQAGAAKMGLARALMSFDLNLEGSLRDAGLLTRDSRMKERKKYGQRGARRRFQFSKR